MTKVSILMPAYNAEKHIEQSIESVLGQTFPDFELLILDDRSIDSTWDIMQKYAREDARIRIWRQESNSGVSPTRNSLIRASSAPFVAWQDADDISVPHRIEAQLNYLEARPAVAIVGAHLQVIDEDNTPLSIRAYAENDDDIRKNIFKYSPISQPVAMIRRTILKQAGPFDESLKQAEDLDLSFRIGRLGKFANVQEPLLRYRFHANSISNKKLKENIACTLEVRRRAVDKYGYKMTASDKLAYHTTQIAQYLPASFVQKSFITLRALLTRLHK